MSLSSTSHDNIVMDSYRSYYDDTIGMNVVDDTPIVSNIYGHLQDISFSPEVVNNDTHERDKSIRYRFVVYRTPEIAKNLKLGQLLKVTKTKHIFTGRWVPVNTGEQYVIKYINEIHSAGPYVTLGLSRKDQS